MAAFIAACIAVVTPEPEPEPELVPVPVPIGSWINDIGAGDVGGGGRLRIVG